MRFPTQLTSKKMTMFYKLFTLVLLTILYSNAVVGQYIPLVEEGKFWIYKNYLSSDSPKAISGHAITFLGDTVINSKTYKKVYRLDLKGQHNCPPMESPCWDFEYPYQHENKVNIGFIREDVANGKIYNLPNDGNHACGVGEYLLFDFAVSIGDTLNCSVYESILANQTVGGGIADSIKVIESHGKLRNSIFTYGFYTIVGLPYELEIPISEGIGFRDYGIFYKSKSDFVDFCEGPMEQCQLILSNNATYASGSIDVFPNPSSGKFHISMDKERIKSIRTYTMLGAFKKEVIGTNVIDLSNLEHGVYLLEIVTNDQQRLVRKVVLENG